MLQYPYGEENGRAGPGKGTAQKKDTQSAATGKRCSGLQDPMKGMASEAPCSLKEGKSRAVK